MTDPSGYLYRKAMNLWRSRGRRAALALRKVVVGRPALLLSVTTEETLHQWWFDPSSLQLLARQDGPGPSPGGGLQIVESAGIVSGDDSSELVSTFAPPPLREPTLG